MSDTAIHDEPVRDEHEVVAEEAPATSPSSAHSADDAVDATDPTAALTAERDEYLDSLRRLQAEFENFRKRVRRESEDEFKRAVAWTVDRLLPVLDALDGAKRHHPDVVEPLESVVAGALLALGVDRLEPLGEPFDPESHDAVAFDEPDQAEDLTIVEVLRPGYRCRGQLVRPAMVRVGRPPATDDAGEDAEG
jgi:molecular chaperone GrpE